MELRELILEFGFEFIDDGNYNVVKAKNTDGEWTKWFSFDKTKNIFIVRGNTDYLNIWLSETRKDLSAERLIAFANRLNKIAPVSISELIDPEDWQEIAGVKDAFDDPRYFNREDVLICEECEYRECFDCPKAID